MKALLCGAAVGTLTLAAQAADFSYYALVLSWTPNHCAEAGLKRDPALCAPDRRLGFVVNTLAPLANNGRPPVGCGVAPALPRALVQSMVSYIPTEAGLSRAWSAHGVCTGLTAAEYFALTRQLRDSIRIPAALLDLQQPMQTTAQELGDLFGQENRGIPREGIRLSCSARGLVQDVTFCFDKNGIARSCGSVPDCTRLNVGLAPMPPRRIR
jgi:ribonuclease T2